MKIWIASLLEITEFFGRIFVQIRICIFVGSEPYWFQCQDELDNFHLQYQVKTLGILWPHDGLIGVYSGRFAAIRGNVTI